MLRFQISVHGCEHSAASSLSVTFDDALAVLAALDRLFIEPDGSFVWRGTSPDGELWQVDGNLIDGGDRLAYVELKGCCPEKEFDSLLAAFDWPEARLVFQLQQRGVFVGKEEFRRLAATEAGAI
jgi:hypothetical protein